MCADCDIILPWDLQVRHGITVQTQWLTGLSWCVIYLKSVWLFLKWYFNHQCSALNCLPSGVKNILPITTAKVPIVKFYHVRTGLEGDISLYNTLVGSCYSCLFYFVLNIPVNHLLSLCSLISGSAQHQPLSFVRCHRHEGEDPLLCHEGFCQSEYALHTFCSRVVCLFLY